ncbi:hypothetical protein Glove_551g69 [Diversispora epigaea]|uniref:Uncharacterized protein n=1 Tax=Diversispora epigaea TaxID=1348612 RepID=A0A397GBR0_9GLOM|nr:hypothetical protein Glove_551g69 [Diversispora epigaea]
MPKIIGQHIFEYDLEEYYNKRQFETAKSQIGIEKCMLNNGMLYGQEKKIVKFNIQQIDDKLIPWNMIIESRKVKIFKGSATRLRCQLTKVRKIYMGST